MRFFFVRQCSPLQSYQSDLLIPVAGDVINHGKHQYWGKPGVHYHQGMEKGENTLNALCARVVLRDIAARGR